MSFEIKPATRVNVRPLVSFYAESGCGKTFSALLLARGFVGPTGRVCMVDSERGRGSLYADVLPGGYDVLTLDEPFSPAHYCEAMDAVESAGYQIGILDSGSHEWEMGVLDMAAEAEEKSGKAGLHNWRIPKMEHNKFVSRLVRSAIPWVICLRAKFKTRQGKDDRGKTIIIKDEHTSPLQAEDFLFEMTAHGEIMPDHSFRLTKSSHPTLGDCFPTSGPITQEHGQLLAQWCAAPAAKVFGAPSTPPPADPPKKNGELSKLKKKLWAVTQGVRRNEDGAIGKRRLEQWLWDENILSDTENLDDLPESRLAKIINEAQHKLDVPTP